MCEYRAEPNSMADLQNVERFFKEADTDGSGYLTLQELSGMLQRNGYKLDEKKIQGMFNAIDVEGDKKVSKDEYLQAMGVQPPKEHKSAHMRRVFRSFDKSGDGKIDRAELDAAMDEFRSDLTDAEVSRMLSLADKDNSGTLDYEEFIKEVFN